MPPSAAFLFAAGASAPLSSAGGFFVKKCLTEPESAGSFFFSGDAWGRCFFSGEALLRAPSLPPPGAASAGVAVGVDAADCRVCEL